jgi:carbamoyl-phosphate synthase large subunit
MSVGTSLGFTAAESAELRIAVTGVSGDVGLGVLEGLRALGERSFLLGLDYSDDCAGYQLTTTWVQTPPVAAADYVDVLTEALRRHRIGMLIPGIDSEILLLAQQRERIERETGCFVMVAGPELVAACVDKLETGPLCAAHGLPYVRTWVGQRTLPPGASYPLIAKPRRGWSSRDVTVLETPEDHLAWAVEDVSKYCLQPFIEGEEYTVGLTFDREEILRDWLVMRRTLTDGRTTFAETCDLPQLDDVLAASARTLHARGALNLQLRVDVAGRPRIFEVNPRLSGSTQIRVAIGYNDPLRLVRHHLLGMELEKARVRPARVHRVGTQVVVTHV